MNPSEKEFQMFVEGFRQGKEHGYQCGKANLDTLSKDYKISQALYEKEATKLTKIAFDLIAEIRYNDEAENNRNKDCGCCGANLAAVDYAEHLAGRYDEAAVLEPMIIELKDSAEDVSDYLSDLADEYVARFKEEQSE